MPLTLHFAAKVLEMLFCPDHLNFGVINFVMAAKKLHLRRII
jgi:hypothetical protein